MGSKLRVIFKPTVLWKQHDTIREPYYCLSLKCPKMEVIPSDYVPTVDDMYKLKVR